MPTSSMEVLGLREKTYEALRELLISGECRTGAPLTEAKIANRLGVSRTPVREALVRLADEGLIETKASGTRIVADLSSKVIEVLHVRARLEPFGVGLAAHRVTGTDLDALWSIQKQIEDLRDDWERNCDELLDLNRAFHRQIVGHCGNASLVEVLDRLSPFSVLPRTLTLYSARERNASFDEHRAILDALWKRDQLAAETLARAHIMRGVDAIQKAFA